MNLEEQIAKWNQDANHDNEDLFLEWMQKQASLLDIPSKNAYRIYRNLAAYAYTLTKGVKQGKDVSDLEESAYFVDAIQTIYMNHENTLQNDIDFYQLASTLLDFSYAEFGNERNRTPEQVWRYLTVDQHGNLTAEAIGARIPNLLKGSESVKKADLLFLLWYTCNLFWNWDNEDNFIELYDKISGFWELSIEVLDEAMLPNFYIPHLLERCFLNSI